jgi:Kef-type K+ transport system membrane component KefB
VALSEVNERLLLAVAVVIAAAAGVGWLARRVGQPKVMGEIVAGILLGPSLLGVLWPDAVDYLFPPQVVGALSAVAQLGLVLFMFLVGAELELGQLRSQGRRALVISQVSILVPLVSGAVLALWLYPRVGGDVDRVGFSLFIGAAMAITAFPVLARILRDSGLASTRLGALVLTCAAIDDVSAWGVLAVVVAIVTSSGPADVVATAAWAGVFVLVMLFAVRPFIARSRLVTLPVAVAFAFVSAWIADLIGVHAVFGAFVAGATISPSVVGRLDLVERLETATSTILLPVFFVVAGLSTRIGLLDSAYLWGIAALVVAVAIGAKLGGSSVAARLTGESWRDALTIGVLMNARGLTEIVILTVGLELGVINQTVFTVMVLMALVTTFMTGPLLRVVRPEPGADPLLVR